MVIGDTPIYDPYEDLNRFMFAFNDAMDDAYLVPIAEAYRQGIPAPGRTGIRNVLRNLRSPLDFTHQLLQGDLGGAHDVALRTVVNTFVGAGGLFDVAGHEGIEYEQEDFGQTLGKWGVGHGPYVVLPFMGPSSLRDYVGFFVDALANPLRIYLHNIDEDGIYYGILATDMIDTRASLLDVLRDLENSSIDYYASVRSIYYQRRDAMLNDEDPDKVGAADIPDYDDY